MVERNDRQGFELMGTYTNPLWHQMSVVDDCLLVDNRLAVPEKLRQAVLRRLHQGHPGQEAMLEVSNYLWWPHMHKDIVNMAEECRSCTRYDKEHLERSALTASQLKRRIDQSRENVKIIRKGQNSRNVSPLFLRNTAAAKERARAKKLKQLLEANARWNVTRRDISDSELRRVVDETNTINPELRKELLYSWERGFIEVEQPAINDNWSGSFLRKHEQRKSGKALTIPLKGKIVSETPSTIKTAAGAVYRKSDLARSKLQAQPKAQSSEKKRSPMGEEPRSKQQKTITHHEDVDSESAEEHDVKDQ